MDLSLISYKSETGFPFRNHFFTCQFVYLQEKDTAMNELTHFIKAKQELALATNIDEIKEIRDKAEALRFYCKQAGESLEMQNNCAEIKIRAERRAGELLPDTIKEGNPQLSDDMTVVKLKDIGISRNQSSKYQQIATIPEDKFEEHIAAVKEK